MCWLAERAACSLPGALLRDGLPANPAGQGALLCDQSVGVALRVAQQGEGQHQGGRDQLCEGGEAQGVRLCPGDVHVRHLQLHGGWNFCGFKFLFSIKILFFNIFEN